jgi:hypothetical protein
MMLTGKDQSTLRKTHAVALLVEHRATSRKVVGSIPSGVIEMFR